MTNGFEACRLRTVSPTWRRTFTEGRAEPTIPTGRVTSSARGIDLWVFLRHTDVLTRVRSLLWSLVLLAFVGCGWFEISEKTFPTYEDAVKADWVGEGRRIPSYTPQSAVEIRVRADAESNETWLFYRASAEDIHSMVASCRALSATAVKYPRTSPGGWWPESLRAGKEDESSRRHKYYECRDKTVTAVDQGRSEVFEWRFSS